MTLEEISIRSMLTFIIIWFALYGVHVMVEREPLRSAAGRGANACLVGIIACLVILVWVVSPETCR